jgi:hypothetical protein
MDRLAVLVAMTSDRAAAGLDLALALATAAIIAWGVVALGWSPFVVMMLFWFENVVIGVANVARMLVTGAQFGVVGLLGGVAISAFFTLHYGMFTAVHGLFVVQLFGTAEIGRDVLSSGITATLASMLRYLFSERDGWLAVLAIALLHLSGFVQWLGRARELAPSLKDQMTGPYGRIMILHVTLIASGFLVQAVAPAAGALLLVALKLGYDLFTLGRDHRQHEEHAAQVKARRLLITGRRGFDGPR